jgi:hypothetical protein
VRRTYILGAITIVSAIGSPAAAQQRAQTPAQTPAQSPQPTPALQPNAEELAARAAFQRGVQALEDSQFAEAVSAFEESFRRNPLPVVLFNLAFAYRGLGRNQDAIATLDRFLSDPGQADAEMLQNGREERDRLRATLVRLTVRTTPPGATVLVDGRRPTREGDALVLDPGRRVIEVSLDGFRPHREERTLAPGASDTAAVTLAVIDDAGRLRVEPSVPSARVTIDDVFAGTGIVERPARMGTHRVVITAEGFLPLERTVRVGGTGLVRVDATLQRPRANPWPWLGPTIGVAAAVGIGLTSWAVAEALRPVILPMPANCWDCGVSR